MLIHHEQYIFIIYDSACQLAEKKTIFKLSKLIELKFISTTWPHYLNLTSKVAHQQVRICLKLFLITLKALKFT